VNRQPWRVLTGEMLAYVDDCLPRLERAILEDSIAAIPEINDQIAHWLSQNEAIRAAFPERVAARTPNALRGGANRTFALDAGARPLKPARESWEPDRRPGAVAHSNLRPPRPGAALRARARRAKPKRNALVIARRMLFVSAGALAFWAAGGLARENDPGEFASAATAAYRTFADDGTRPVEIATSNFDALNQWFASQIVAVRPLADAAVPGLNLIGGRVVPGAFTSAEYWLYENGRHERIALEIEAIDAPPESGVAVDAVGEIARAFWTGAGRRFALVGRAPRAQLAELARLLRQGQARR
jgi:anti-sigma factor RsiW